jgi:tetratricopeptide (TPR) repeat protein
LAFLASAYEETGQIRESLRVIDEALVASARNGERFYEAELYRMRGELTLQQFKVQGAKSNVASPQSAVRNPQLEAEECFRQAIAIAREQRAKSWELRAATSLARLWQSQGKLSEAREQLEGVYAWFTEGFDTKDLQEAAALLRELGSTEENQKSKINTQNTKRETGDQNQEALLSSRLLSTLPPQAAQSALASTPHTPHPTQDADTLSSVLGPQSVPSPVLGPQPPAPNIFRSEGEYWTVSFAGTTCRLKEARGLHYISHLLQHPHQEVHVISLITPSGELSEGPAAVPALHDASLGGEYTEGFRDTGEILDPQARGAYKQRLAELQEELAEAQQFHDLGRSEQVAAEIDFLTHELASAVGLGGRARRVGSAAERARVNITRAIKIALRKISEHHPALGQHLATTIKTGAYCSYTPDVRLPITWQG